MQENNHYTEYTVTPRQSAGSAFKKAAFYAAFTVIPLALCLLILLSGNPTLFILIPAIIGIFGGCAFFFSRFLNVEYEYSVYGEEFTLSRIFGKRSRKDMCVVDLRKCERVAPYGRAGFESDTHLADNCRADAVYKAVSDMSADNVYFMLVNDDGRKTLIFFEPNDKFSTILRFYCRSAFVQAR